MFNLIWGIKIKFAMFETNPDWIAIMKELYHGQFFNIKIKIKRNWYNLQYLSEKFELSHDF